MSVYVQVVDKQTKNKKNQFPGQLTLFDLAQNSDKSEFELQLPPVGEYEKDMLLGFEKEVLGIYVSGHPLDDDQELLARYVTNTTIDFAIDPDTGKTEVIDQSIATIGGMITDKTLKYTKNNQVMAFITVEDLLGSVEVVVFPRDYEQYGYLLVEDAKIFVKGKVSLEEEKDGKLLCEQICGFEEIKQDGWKKRSRSKYTLPTGLWIQFPSASDYAKEKARLLQSIEDSDGKDQVIIYLKDTKKIQVLPANLSVHADKQLQERLSEIYGESNVKLR